MPTKEEAEILNIQAEAERRRAEAAHFASQQQLRAAETRKATAEAEREEHQAAIAAVTRRERERVEEALLASDFYTFRHYFEGRVDEKSVFNCLTAINTWHRQDPESNWHITINSPGGSVVDGFHLFDQLAVYSKRGGGTHHITMTVRGEAASMAGILLQVADERVVGKRSQILIHEISSWASGNINAIKDDVKRLDMLTESVVDLFMERSEGKIAREDFIKAWTRRDWWITAQQAVEYGFADREG